MQSRLPMFGRIARGSVGAVLLAVWGLTALAPAPTATAATTVTGSTVTYSSNITVPAPPSSNFSGASSGDGWAVAVSDTQIFNVFHHHTILQVDCHNQSDASDCWTAPKTIIDGSGNNFDTSSQPGLWLDLGTGDLYVYATRPADNTAGVVCINTQSSSLDPFCGYTPLTTAGDGPPTSFPDGGTSDPISVDGKFYAMNNVATSGAPTGSQDKLLCFSETTFSACSGQPYSVNLGADSGGISEGGYPSPSIALIGTQLVIPVLLNSGDGELTCYNVATAGACSGSWPVAAPGGYVTNDGGPFPLLNGSDGTVKGVCLPDPDDSTPCYTLTGASTATPPGLATETDGTIGWSGPGLVIGARVYIPLGDSNSVACYDYAAQTACAGFGTNGVKQFTGLDLLYSVNPDPQRPTCIWVNSDNGVAQIQNFDAYTGGACGAGSIRVLTSSVVVPQDQCIPANYTSLQILSPARSSYTSAAISFENFNGNPIAGLPSANVDATGTVDLSSLGLSTKSALPQFLINITGGGTITSVEVKLTWTGTYSTACVANGITVSGSGPSGYRLTASDGGVFSFGSDGFSGALASTPLNAPIVGIASTNDDQGYWLAGADGGVFAFGDASFDGAGLGLDSSDMVGIAGDPTGQGYWLAGADGGVFAFGDAKFYGSAVGVATSPIVGIAAVPGGGGYWLAAADGNVYPFGTAKSYGSAAAFTLNAPIVGIAATPDGAGYWLTGGDGGVFAFGDATYEGSALGVTSTPVVGIAAAGAGGYWLGSADGGVFSYGDAQFLGCMANSALNASEVAMAT